MTYVPPVAAAGAGFFGLAAGAAAAVVALSDGVWDQASGAQLSSAATAIAVLCTQRFRMDSFLGPTAAFMRHLGLAENAVKDAALVALSKAALLSRVRSLELGRDRFELDGVPRAEGKLRPLRGEEGGDAPTDALVGAGDDGDFAG